MTQVGLGTYQKAITQAGKPITIGDVISWSGVVTAISGTGPTATITATGEISQASVANLQAQDIAASSQNF